MAPMEAIVAGMSNAVKLMGWDNRIAALRAGLLADVVAVPGDHARQPRSWERVMKNGVIHAQPAQ